MSITIREVGTGSPRSFKFKAFRGGLPVGYIEIALGERVQGRAVATVENVFVQDSARRTGVATKLYEAAAEKACEHKTLLASTYRTQGAYSLHFWEKQLSKGRAEQIVRNYYDQPAYMLLSCDVKDLSGLRRKRRKKARR